MSELWEDEGFGSGGAAPSDDGDEGDDWDEGDDSFEGELEDGLEDSEELDDDWDEGEER